MLKNFLSAENKKRKSYVLDTSVLVYHGEAIHNFPDSNIYIPLEVLEELDNLKTRMDKVGANGRYVNKYLDKLRNKGSLIDGVEIENNMIIYIAAFSDITLLPLSMSDTVDNKIISCGLVLAKEDHDVTVVSRDISLRVRCDSLDIDAIDYDKELHLKRDFFNDGIITIKTTTDVIDQFYETGVVDLDDYEQYELLPNQGVMLKCGQSSALGLAVDDRTVKRLNYASDKGFEMEGIAPRSAEQSIAAELLMDPDIHLVTMTGMAGSGKTLLSIAAALKQIQTKRYKKIMLARPAESTSAEIGFLPGLKSEKLEPWLQPFFDNLEVILGANIKNNSYFQKLMEKGIIEMEAISFIRGRTLPNTIFIIDEAQNISHHEAKALLTRMGENSKIVLIGDLEQIDSKHLDEKTSGLASVVDLFKEFEHAGHIRLRKGERSKLATYAAKVM